MHIPLDLEPHKWCIRTPMRRILRSNRRTLLHEIGHHIGLDEDEGGSRDP